MKINRLILGPLDTNCYILEKDNKCLIIDPADDYQRIIDVVGNKDIVGVIITHYHFDHIGALDSFSKKLILDKNNFEEKEYNISGFDFEIIYTPGHKEDAITIYFKEEKAMFTGDFIFKGTIGRTDLPGGNYIEMFKSLDKISKYDKNIDIYPGHGEKTKLYYEVD